LKNTALVALDIGNLENTQKNKLGLKSLDIMKEYLAST